MRASKFDFKKELQAVLDDVHALSLELQDMVAEDILESARARVATMKRITNKNDE